MKDLNQTIKKNIVYCQLFLQIQPKIVTFRLRYYLKCYFPIPSKLIYQGYTVLRFKQLEGSKILSKTETIQ